MPAVERDVERERGPRPVEVLDRDWGSLPPPVPPDGEGGGWSDAASGPPVSNARLGMWMLLAGETMFFGGLVAAFLVLRAGASVWPPPLQPRLPIGVTAVNTVVLLLSSYALARAVRAVRRADQHGLVAWLAGTALLGATFLVGQGAEWVRLLRFGLTASSGAYGATFYTVIGVHGVHVLAALVWLTFVLVAAARRRYSSLEHEGLFLCAMYWHFVVALWPILYVLVYLT